MKYFILASYTFLACGALVVFFLVSVVGQKQFAPWLFPQPPDFSVSNYIDSLARASRYGDSLNYAIDRMLDGRSRKECEAKGGTYTDFERIKAPKGSSQLDHLRFSVCHDMKVDRPYRLLKHFIDTDKPI